MTPDDYQRLLTAATDVLLGRHSAPDIYACAIAWIERLEAYDRRWDHVGRVSRHQTLDELDNVAEWDRGAKVARRPKRSGRSF